MMKIKKVNIVHFNALLFYWAIMLVLLLFYSFNASASNLTATQAGMVDFKVHENLTADDMNGTNDVTEKLQRAVNYARDNTKTLFIPSGTYKISKTIECIVDHTDVDTHQGEGAVVIVGSSVKRPVIKLADNSPDFQGTGMPNQTNGPNAIFELRSDSYPSKKSSWIFYCGIRSIDIDLGKGNPGAIGISWASAQSAFLEDISIEATGAWAGIAGFPGRNALTGNVQVNGGRFGFYFTKSDDTETLWGDGVGYTLVGCKLLNQTENAMRIYGWAGVTLVGFEIKMNSGSAVWLRGSSNPNDCPLAMIDSKIEFITYLPDNLVIENSGKATLSLTNVFAKNSNLIVYNNNDEDLKPLQTDGTWTGVARYHYISKSAKVLGSTNVEGFHFIDGKQQKEAISELLAKAPEVNLITKHIWPETPSFEDDGVFLINPSGGNDRKVIQDAIDTHKKVMLAAGTFNIDGPITLNESTIFFGCPGKRSVLKPLSSWTPTQPVWLIETQNSAAASTYLMEICADLDMSKPFWGGLHWRVGKGSVVRGCIFARSSGGNGEYNLQRVKISENGGGRWYNYCDHKNMWINPVEVNDNHRKVLITGTSQPLTFYGLNLERGGGFKGIVSSYPMCEIVNSSNIRIFGSKLETYQPYAKIVNSSNIQIINVHDWAIANQFKTDQHLITIEGDASKDIEIHNAQWNKPPNSSFKIVEDPWYTNEPDRTMHMGLYKKGSFEASVFDPSGATSTGNLFKKNSPGNLRVFPNPANNGKFNISSDQPIGPVQVYNLSGQVVYGRDIVENEGIVELEESGIFLLKSNESNVKLIVQ